MGNRPWRQEGQCTQGSVHFEWNELSRSSRSQQRIQPSPRAAHDHGLDHAGDHHAGARHHDRQRRAAAHAGQPAGLAGPDHLGADLLHRRRRHRDAADRLAVATASGGAGVPGLGRRLHRRLGAVRAVARRWRRSSLARLLQGVFGAALVPLSQAVLLDINPPREASARRWPSGAPASWSGPILGPTLGGWLTENFDWRWVFFINLPVGAARALRHRGATCRESRPRAQSARHVRLRHPEPGHRRAADVPRPRRAELTGSTRDGDLAARRSCAAVGFAFFVVHTLDGAGQVVRRPRLLKDRNFVTGLLFVFIVGVMLFAHDGAAADLAAGPDGLSGGATPALVTAPRGIGTMIAMIVGRPAGAAGSTCGCIMAVGFGLTAHRAVADDALSRCRWTAAIIVWSGFIQGLGHRLHLRAAVSAAAFATLAPQLRNEGTPIFSLLRNIGGSDRHLDRRRRCWCATPSSRMPAWCPT